ncbi:hypothetical protein PR202_ga24016 [Eleusine coracana subsp. coracana]|uniref:Wax synthase domain-containing protein n=1 Tax=Eleusine coracana subsp. coracana TaxID=191504 RepID=A0AAV5D7B1_ELECO|nr:hypothetical protein PR202_ga24016 [Eleusine coracana subsp. coracana]
MEVLRGDSTVPTVSLAVVVPAAALYAQAASARLPPGLGRLAALLPVIAFFAAVPLIFSSSILRFVAGFFLGWLGTFKLALLAAARGPLDPALPAVPFLFTALFPVKLITTNNNRPASTTTTTTTSSTSGGGSFVSLLHLYRYMDTLHVYLRYTVYCLHLYLLLDLLIPCTALLGRLVLGMELEPQFDRPYLASSLREFWGRRWNLMVSAVLRAAVYDPVRSLAAGRNKNNKEVAAAASFLVSGVMHEAMACYLLLRPPTGEMVAFFLLHCAFCLVEDRCVRMWRAMGWPAPPRVVTFLGLAAFMAVTMFWLFLPPVCRDGGEEMLRAEWAAVPAFFLGAAQKLLPRYVLYMLFTCFVDESSSLDLTTLDSLKVLGFPCAGLDERQRVHQV